MTPFRRYEKDFVNYSLAIVNFFHWSLESIISIRSSWNNVISEMVQAMQFKHPASFSSRIHLIFHSINRFQLRAITAMIPTPNFGHVSNEVDIRWHTIEVINLNMSFLFLISNLSTCYYHLRFLLTFGFYEIVFRTILDVKRTARKKLNVSWIFKYVEYLTNYIGFKN